MTFCLGIRLKTGIVGISDTRITSGNETTRAKKVFVLNRKKHSLFIMTSGLRSIRDKTITYFNEVLEEQDNEFNKLYKAVNALADQVRRVNQEDKNSLEDSGLNFNLHAIVGGQLENDERHKLFMLYPQGNWIEIGQATPYIIIGNTGYGRPILDRSVKYESNIKYTLKSAFLSFDATRISSNDVDYPIDIILYLNNSYRIIEHRFDKNDLERISDLWREKIEKGLNEMPDDWMGQLLSKLPQENLDEIFL
jgi:putative proteasome-type protease